MTSGGDTFLPEPLHQEFLPQIELNYLSPISFVATMDNRQTGSNCPHLTPLKSMVIYNHFEILLTLQFWVRKTGWFSHMGSLPCLQVCCPTWCQEAKQSSDGQSPVEFCLLQLMIHLNHLSICSAYEKHHFSRLIFITVDFNWISQTLKFSLQRFGILICTFKKPLLCISLLNKNTQIRNYS